MTELRVDPDRRAIIPETATGIYVRALSTTKNVPVTVDIAHLDRESLIAWLRSRGGENLWAENTVLLLLGHRPLDEESRS